MELGRWPTACLCAALTLGCVVTETREPYTGGRGEVRHADALRVWHVMAEGRLEGEVVLFQGKEGGADAHYVVRNVWQQDLGIVDSVGRAYRFVPHAPEPVWVGTGTVAQGAARILQLGADCTLVEVGTDFLPVPAAARIDPPPAR